MACFANGDLVEVDAAPYRAHARVRDVHGARLHLAFERGAYLPWTDQPVQIRRQGAEMSDSLDARILHTSDTTAILELVSLTDQRTSIT